MSHLGEELTCLLCILVSQFLVLTGAGAPSLSLDSVSYITQCHSGLVDSKDRFIFEGTVNTNQTNVRLWSSNITFEMQNNSGTYQPLCAIELQVRRNGSLCYATSGVAGVFQIVVNMTSKAEYSGSLARLSWFSNDTKTSVSSNQMRIRKVYTSNDVSVNVALNSRITTFRTGSDECKLKAGLGVVNRMRLCCSNVTTPCWTSIVINGSYLAQGYPCAVYSFIPHTEDFYASVNFTVATCTQEAAIKSYLCDLEAVPILEAPDYAMEEIVLITAIAITALMIAVCFLHAAFKRNELIAQRS